MSAMKSSSTYAALLLWYAFAPIKVQPPVFTTLAYSTSNLCIPTSFNRRHEINPNGLKRMYGSSRHEAEGASFRRGDKIQVEVIFFGPLGASVEVIGHNSHNEEDLIPEGENPLGYGLILQKEIKYFRDARQGIDVLVGEILPAYVDQVRPEDGKLNIALRVPGMKAKANDLAEVILARCHESENGEIGVGDKSTPDQINDIFPGASKSAFKRAVSSLYKRRLVQPGPFVTRLVSK